MTEYEELSNNIENKAPENNDIKGIVNELVQESPECDILEPSDEINTNPNLYDKKGRPFDITLHKTDENGLPLLNQDGTAKIKGRKQRNQETSNTEQNQTQNQTELENFSLEQAGQMFAAYTFAFCSGVFGKEFKPKQTEAIDENKLISDAYTQYLKAKDIEQMPPGIILIGALSLYLIPRFMEEKVQEKIGSKIKRVYKKIFKR